jgi:hypothetical protein
VLKINKTHKSKNMCKRSATSQLSTEVDKKRRVGEEMDVKASEVLNLMWKLNKVNLLPEEKYEPFLDLDLIEQVGHLTNKPLLEIDEIRGKLSSRRQTDSISWQRDNFEKNQISRTIQRLISRSEMSKIRREMCMNWTGTTHRGGLSFTLGTDEDKLDEDKLDMVQEALRLQGISTRFTLTSDSLEHGEYAVEYFIGGNIDGELQLYPFEISKGKHMAEWWIDREKRIFLEDMEHGPFTY